MECFNSLLHKLQEVHEREVEGWQVKIQELSNKKGCDTKRMEELFTKNQQMKEQQRLLTENIKTLENRLRAGLCDRCTVTQEVAKRRQQEFEASQIQSLQHISLLAGEMNNLKKENKRLRDDIRSLKVLERGHSEHSSSSSSSSSSTTTEVKPNSPPDLSPSSAPVALVTTATSRAGNQPADGDAAGKSEAEQRAEGEEETEHRQWRPAVRGAFESAKLCASPSWKADHCATRVGDRRAQGVEGLSQRPPIPPQALLLKTSSLSASGEVTPSRHVLHAPVPCRPQPIKSGPVTFPWSLSESADWGPALRTGLQAQPPSRLSLPRFPNLIPPGQHASPRRQGAGPLWHKQGALKTPAKEPTVLFRLRSVSEDVESPAKPVEKKETPPSKAEKASGEVLREVCEGPLDLSERGKSKSSQAPRDYSTTALLGRERAQSSPDKDGKSTPSADTPVASPPPHATSPSSSSTPPVKQEEESTGDLNHKQGSKEQEQREEVNGKADGKKVPVLTISLRPVVVLETLNSALQKQESLSSNGKSSSPATETGSGSEGQDEEGSQGSSQSCKRKRASVETETDRDSDTDNTQQERKIKITLRTEEKSPS